MSASIYARGNQLYNSLESKYGTAAAEQGWRDAIAAEKAGVDIDGAWRAEEDYKLAGKSVAQLDGSLWSNLTTQASNGILQAPIETATRQITNAVGTAGNGTKDIVKKIASNWGAWLIVAGLGIAAFLYFGGGNFLRSRVSKLK